LSAKALSAQSRIIRAVPVFFSIAVLKRDERNYVPKEFIIKLLSLSLIRKQIIWKLHGNWARKPIQFVR